MTFVGVVWILLMTLICDIGIELNARTQFLLSVELFVLGLFSVVAFVKVYVGDPEGSIKPSLAWVNPFGSSRSRALAGGPRRGLHLLGVGHGGRGQRGDHGPHRNPAAAALVVTVVLVRTYLLVAIAAQAVRARMSSWTTPTTCSRCRASGVGAGCSTSS